MDVFARFGLSYTVSGQLNADVAGCSVALAASNRRISVRQPSTHHIRTIVWNGALRPWYRAIPARELSLVLVNASALAVYIARKLVCCDVESKILFPCPIR